MKTVKEWFESIKDEDVRKRALANYDYSVGYADSLVMAIAYGFYWGDTIEGHDYWYKQFCKAENNEL